MKKEQVRRILVFQGGGIGDVLRIFPVVQSLNAAFSQATITLLLTEAHHGLLKLLPRHDAVSEVIVLELTGSQKNLFRKLLFVCRLRRKSFDLVLNCNRGIGMFESAIVTFLTGARYRGGFDRGGISCLNTTTVKFSASESILEQNLELLQAFGINPEYSDISLDLSGDDLVFAKAFLRQWENQEDFIITIHPGAKSQEHYRSWPMPKYKELVRQLLNSRRVRVLLVGDRSEREALDRIFDGYENPRLINAMGRTSISQAAALISHSHLFIGNDSGPLHLSLALKIPTVAIFGATSPVQVIGPLFSAVVVRTNLPCQPCYTHQPFFRFDCDHVSCLNTLSVAAVLEAADKEIFRLSCSNGGKRVADEDRT